MIIVSPLRLLITVVCTAVSVLSLSAQVPAGDYPNAVNAQGKKQGKWKKLDDQGTVIYVGQFENDIPVGLFTYFDNQARKMTEMDFRNSGKIAYCKMYYVNGKLEAQGKYVGQQKDSTWVFYNMDGLLISEEGYKLGKKEGRSIVYHAGTKQVAEEKIYKNGLEEGKWVQYFADGKLKAEGTYIAGNMEGRATWYYPDGRINIMGNYQHAVKHGVWMYYNADGSVKGKEVWELGKLKSQEQLIKPEDVNVIKEQQQDPQHNPGGGN
jgi:antitoxin component YwqK of YwqJK toxin-antitoxin module